MRNRAGGYGEIGLALSSRNQRLSGPEYRSALAIPRALEAARHVVREGQTRPEEVVAAAREVLDAESGLRVDYVEIVDPEALEPVTAIEDEVLLLVAAYAGDVRLIDNTILARPASAPGG